MYDSKIINIQFNSHAEGCAKAYAVHSRALRHYLTVLTQSFRGSNKNADKSALTKNDLKREKLAIQSAVTGRLFQTLISLWRKYSYSCIA
jgi:hypothetical protein